MLLIVVVDDSGPDHAVHPIARKDHMIQGLIWCRSNVR
jgi:hypothetical protein